MSSPPKLTFGVEIEFVAEIKVPLEHWAAPKCMCAAEGTPLYRYAQRILRQALQDAGLRVNTSASATPDYSRWIVSSDASIIPTLIDSPPFQRVGIEFTSPKFPCDLSTSESSPFQEIAAALRAARSVAKLYTSRSCALHVHLGQENDAPFPLDLAKKFLRIVVAHEETIEKLLDPEITCSDAFNSWCIAPIDTITFEDCDGGLDRAQLIDLTDTYEELAHLLNPYEWDDPHDWPMGSRRHHAWNVLGLDRDASHLELTKPTIEARRHPCTIDAEAIQRWVKFLMTLLKWCQDSAEETVQRLVGESEDIGVPILMERIGLSADDVSYWSRIVSSSEDEQPEDEYC